MNETSSAPKKKFDLKRRQLRARKISKELEDIYTEIHDFLNNYPSYRCCVCHEERYGSPVLIMDREYNYKPICLICNQERNIELDFFHAMQRIDKEREKHNG